MSAFPTPDQTDPEPSSLPSSVRLGPKPEMIGVQRNRSLRYTLLLGAIAGFTFSMAIWAYEAILFFQSHIAYPWLPALTGTTLCVLICMLAALFTYFANRALLGALFWILAARLIAELAIRLPLKIDPAIMILFEPDLKSWLPVYPITSSLRTWAGFGTVWLGIFLGILGLLQLTLVEQAVPATTTGGRLSPYFIFVPVMLLASVMTSNMINQQLRAPLLRTNYLIQYAIDHQNTTIDPELARQMHMSSLDLISSLIDRPRRLFLGSYDEYFTQVFVLIDFDGAWAECTTVQTYPVYCKPLPTP